MVRVPRERWRGLCPSRVTRVFTIHVASLRPTIGRQPFPISWIRGTRMVRGKKYQCYRLPAFDALHLLPSVGSFSTPFFCSPLLLWFGTVDIDPKNLTNPIIRPPNNKAINSPKTLRQVLFFPVCPNSNLFFTLNLSLLYYSNNLVN